MLYWVYIIHLGKTGSIVLCVSPLTTLMMDQKSKFVPMGIQAEVIAERSDEEAVKRVLNGQAQLVYTGKNTCRYGY